MLELPARLPVVDNPLTCVRQLIFESDWEEYPYGMHGTGFIAECTEMLFLVTAAHCINEGQEDWLRVPIRAGTPRVMTFKKYMTFETPGEETRDLDVAALSIEPSDSAEFYDLRRFAAPIPRTFSFESILAEVRDKNLDLDSIVLRAVGFPRNARESRIDVAESRIVSQPMEILFRYSRPSAVTNRHLGVLVSPPPAELDGMSGSPVFLRATRPDEMPQQYVFVGMLVRASRTHVEFVSGELLRSALQHAARALRP